MSTFRKYVRGDGGVEPATVARRIATHTDTTSQEDLEVTRLQAGNWLSVPYVVDDEYFCKVITPQNTRTHSFFTGLRNLGSRMSGGGPFFERHGSPVEMAHHEFRSTQRMRAIGVPAPEPLDVIEGDDRAFLLFEYLDGYEPMSETALTDEIVDTTVGYLRRLHDEGMAHGDFSLENVLVVDDEPHFIDATRVDDDGLEDAVAYDLACVLGALATRMDVEDAVTAVAEHYTVSELQHAIDFLVVARLRPGIERRFSVLDIRRAIDALA